MGFPINHSRSPRLHGHWLRRYGIDGAYLPFAVHPQHLERALRALPALGMRGCNLTIPHKETAFSFVDSVDDMARRIGAINTVVVDDHGRLQGSNTDIFGFQENLKSAGYQRTQDQSVAVVLGAGGAARAVIVGLQEMGFQDVRIVNRSKDRAEKCASDLTVSKGQLSLCDWEKRNESLAGAELLINTTSLGMDGGPPLEIDVAQLSKQAWVMDVVYTPLETDLLKQARQSGLHAVDGLGMLLHQARPGFATWFGKEPEVDDALRQAVYPHDNKA